MILKDLPAFEKPREKAIKEGINSLSNAELLALLLRTGYKSKSAIDLAYDLLKTFNGLEGISNATFKELVKVNGIKKAKALEIMAISEFYKRVKNSKIHLKNVKNPHEIFEILEPKLRDEKQENLIGIFLNSRNFIQKIQVLFKGGLDEHSVHPRDIFREAIKENSARIILVHNHPSGDVSPSKDDIESTKAIDQLGKEMGIHLIDHIIIGKDNYFSMKSNELF